jgi:hypothetical protein
MHFFRKKPNFLGKNRTVYVPIETIELCATNDLAVITFFLDPQPFTHRLGAALLEPH